MPKLRQSSAYTRETREEEVKVKKYLLVHAAQKLIDRQRPGPNNDWLIVSFTTLIATVFVLGTSTFQHRLGAEPAAWHGFALFVLAASILGTAYFGARYFGAVRVALKPMTAEDFYEELCRQMDEDERRIEELEEKAAKEAATVVSLKPAKQPAFDPDKVNPDEIPF